MSVTGLVPVVVVTGPVGVGKSTVLREADVLLVESGSRHATVEMDEIARFWPPCGPGRSVEGLAYRNLASLWANFARAGAERLLSADLVEERSDLRQIEEAVPGASVVVVQLRAPLAALEARVRRRQALAEGELSAARWWSDHLQAEPVGDHVVDTEDRPPPAPLP